MAMVNQTFGCRPVVLLLCHNPFLADEWWLSTPSAGGVAVSSLQDGIRRLLYPGLRARRNMYRGIETVHQLGLAKHSSNRRRRQGKRYQDPAQAGATKVADWITPQE